MDKNSSMERRYSLNASSMPKPNAESTCLNLNGSSSTATHFQWGGNPISPKNRSNSISCLSSSSTAAGAAFNGHRSRNNATSPQRSNKSKIDPRIYADVQSKGLASRIVKYHENGTRLNRSMSVNNLYNKPGQFPVVHLKKTELAYKASNHHNLSMTRIAPPERSMFYGNTLSSLLRSNSIVGLHKTDEEISRENRPILHPPPTEGEMAPTRSVLDVLKEISRKRINNDDLDSANDMTKKYCNRDSGSDFLDNSAAAATAPPQTPTASSPSYQQHTTHLVHQQQSLPTHLMRHQLNLGHNHSNNGPQSYKRQREPHQQLTALSASHQHNQKHLLLSTPTDRRPQASAAAFATTSNASGTQQHSPEQIAKKRLCNYNNDITSSLSSSVKHANKRKFYAERQQAADTTADTSTGSSSGGSGREQSSYLEDYNNAHQQRTKMLRHQQQQQQQLQLQTHPATTELRFKQLQQTLSCNTPITPIPATPLNQSRKGAETIETTAAAAAGSKNTPLPPTVKPKLTLFNAKYSDADDAAAPVTEATPGIDESGESAGINFVRPKKSSAISSARNPLIERTQKCKLAQMLCGLRGEIYHGGDGGFETDRAAADQLDASKTKSPAFIVTPQSAAPTITNTTIDSGASAGKPIATISSLVKTDALVTQAAPTTATTTSTTAGTAPGILLGGFNFAPATTAAVALTTPTAIVTTSTTSIPATIVAVTPPKTSSPLVGLKLTPQAATAVGGGTTATTAAVSSGGNVLASAPATFSFGTPPLVSVATTTTSAAASSSHPVLGGFSFGALAPATTKPATPLSPNRFAPSISAGLTFGATTTTTSIAAPAVSTAAAAMPAFGALSQSASVPPAAAFSLLKNSFPTAATATTTASPAPPTFGSVANIVTPAAIATTATPPPPAFGASVTAAAAGGTPKTFAFGATAVPSAAATMFSTETQANMFGVGSASATVNNNNKTMFGTAAAMSSTTSNTGATAAGGGGFSFSTAGGGAPKPSVAAAPFSFGTPIHASTAAVAPATAATSALLFANASSAANNTTTSTFAFGGNSATIAGVAAAPTFAFGGAQAPNKPAAAGGGFAFGGAAPPTTTVSVSVQSSSPNLFGTPSITNVVKPSFSFGGATATPDSASLFGGGAAASVANNTFGSLAAASNSTQNKTFSFGSGTNGSNNVTSPPQTSNLFATAASAPAAANKPLMGGFSFGNAAANAPNTQQQQHKPTTAAALPTPGGSSAFSFAGSATTAPPFAFGSPATQSAASKSFAFGGATNNQLQQQPAPAASFSFSGQPSAAVAPTAANGNMFAPPPTNMAAGPGGDRPIRRATRRLQKS